MPIMRNMHWDLKSKVYISHVDARKAPQRCTDLLPMIVWVRRNGTLSQPLQQFGPISLPLMERAFQQHGLFHYSRIGAIIAALPFLVTILSRLSVVLCDSRSALQFLSHAADWAPTTTRHILPWSSSMSCNAQCSTCSSGFLVALKSTVTSRRKSWQRQRAITWPGSRARLIQGNVAFTWSSSLKWNTRRLPGNGHPSPFVVFFEARPFSWWDSVLEPFVRACELNEWNGPQLSKLGIVGGHFPHSGSLPDLRYCPEPLPTWTGRQVNLFDWRPSCAVFHQQQANAQIHEESPCTVFSGIWTGCLLVTQIALSWPSVCHLNACPYTPVIPSLFLYFPSSLPSSLFPHRWPGCCFLNRQPHRN